MAKIVKGKIGNALTSTAADHVVAVANDIFDEQLEKYQSILNALMAVLDENGDVQENPFHVVQNEEYLYAVVDAEDKLLIGIRHDGEIIEGKIPLKTRQEIEHVKTELSRNVLAVEMDRATGRIIGHTDNDSRIKSCVQDRVTGIITINQVIE